MANITAPPTKAQFKYVTYVEQHWHEHKMFPSTLIASKALGVSVDEIKQYLNDPTVQTMLSNRGVEIDLVDTSNLSEEQLAAVNAYLNLADPRPISVKLKDLGISPTRFNGWMNGKAFQRYIQERAEELFSDGMPFAHRELMNKVMQGDIKAIRLFYEISGRYTGQQSNELQNVTVVMQRILEAIQLEIGDPTLIDRVAKRFQSIMAGEPIGLEKVTPRNALPVGEVSSNFIPQDERKVTYVKTNPDVEDSI